MIFLQGSGHLSLYLFLKKSNGTAQIVSNVPPVFQLADKFHVVVIGKPGVPFIDSLKADSYEEFVEKYPPPKEDIERLSLEWLVDSASLVIDYPCNKLPIKNKEIRAVGYSEAGQIVPRLALTNKKLQKF